MAQRMPFIVAEFVADRRPLHASHLCGIGREGAAPDLRADPIGVSGAQGARCQAGQPDERIEALAIGRRTLAADADAFAANVLPIINALRRAGITDLRGVAAALNSRGVRTARGGRWHVSNVRNLLLRSASLC